MQRKLTKILLATAFLPAALASWFIYREMTATVTSYVLSVALFVFIWLALFAIQGAVLLVCGYRITGSPN
jgi:hypothetical protein